MRLTWRPLGVGVSTCVCVQQNCYFVILLWFDAILGLAFAATQRILFNQENENR